MDDTNPRKHGKLRLFVPSKQSFFYGGGLAENWLLTSNLALMPRFQIIKFLVLEKKQLLYI